MRVQAVEGQRVEKLREMKPEDFSEGEDSDGEEMVFCHHCRLPVGVNCYLTGDNKDVPVHGECVAQMMLNDLKKEDATRKEEDAATKTKLRADYGIGWNVHEVPSNMLPAMKLDCGFEPRGMCCVVFDDETRAVQVAPTLEPAESINLEYLSLALQVRVLEGREPMFSLDPVCNDGERKKNMMQEKCFEPEWLAGTSVGEVLFQADYHLKELSMGQYEQPVVGMKSCLDLSGSIDGQEWNAREWFIVRKAEVLMTQDNVLVPRVKMGVEAREQVVAKDGLEDKLVTQTSHPLVQYAEQFTHYFDLIAERKSVIYHLRDLAKASVMAKMMVEANVNAEGPWLDLAGESKEVSSMEVPQIWNHHLHTQVRVRDNQIVSASDKARSRGVYGGVQFGLDRTAISVPTLPAKPRAASVVARPAVSLSAMKTPSLGITAKPTAAAPAPGAAPEAPAAKAIPTKPRITAAKGAPTPTRKVGISVAQEKPVAITAHGITPTAFSLVEGKPTDKPAVSGTRLMAMPTSRTPLMPAIGVAPKPSVAITPIVPPRPELRGVDLNLDQFSFSEPTRVEGLSWGSSDHEVKCASLGNSFWSSLESGADFNDDAKMLLNKVFNPQLSDRREEGEHFVPPETTHDYVKSLSALVNEEQQTCEQRKEHFLSQEFSVSNPGELFPKSWVPSVEIVSEKEGNGNLQVRSDYLAQSEKFAHALTSTTPTFERTSEDGVCYRIYELGSLQVRTTQESDEQEIVGAVYSTNAPAQAVRGLRLEKSDRVVKVMEYVEKVQGTRCSYVVYETESGSAIVTEKRRDGTVAWEENPSDLNGRNALAKLVRSAECNGHRFTVGDLKNFHTKESRVSVKSASGSECKRYAQSAFSRAVAKIGGIYTGFRRSEKMTRWQLL